MNWFEDFELESRKIQFRVFEEYCIESSDETEKCLDNSKNTES